MLELKSLAFTNFDLLILAIVSLSTIFALFRGLIKSLISFVGWVVAFICAVEFVDFLVPIFEKYTASKELSRILSAATIFLLSSIILAIFNSIVVAFLSVICGGIIDRSLGLFFGFVRGCFLVSIAFYFMIMMWPSLDVKERSDVYTNNSSLPKWAKKSETLLLLSKGSSFINQYVPDSFKAKISKSFDDSEVKVQYHNSNARDASDNLVNYHKNVLSILPRDFVNDIDEKDILTLQNPDASHHEKVHVLEKIADRYERYHGKKIYYDSTREEIQKHNQEHHKIMRIIESEIRHYNALITDY